MSCVAVLSQWKPVELFKPYWVILRIILSKVVLSHMKSYLVFVFWTDIFVNQCGMPGCHAQPLAQPSGTICITRSATLKSQMASSDHQIIRFSSDSPDLHPHRAQLATALTAAETELLGSCSARGWKVRPVGTTTTSLWQHCGITRAMVGPYGRAVW